MHKHSDILIKIQHFSYKETPIKLLSTKQQPFCHGHIKFITHH